MRLHHVQHRKRWVKQGMNSMRRAARQPVWNRAQDQHLDTQVKMRQKVRKPFAVVPITLAWSKPTTKKFGKQRISLYTRQDSPHLRHRRQTNNVVRKTLWEAAADYRTANVATLRIHQCTTLTTTSTVTRTFSPPS